MDTSKIKEAISDLEAQIAKHEADAAKCRHAVKSLMVVLGSDEEGLSEDDIELFSGGYSKVSPHRIHRSRPALKSTLQSAIDILTASKQPMHIKELVPLVSGIRGTDTPRASIESVLVRAITEHKHGIKRTEPGTFTVEP